MRQEPKLYDAAERCVHRVLDPGLTHLCRLVEHKRVLVFAVNGLPNTKENSYHYNSNKASKKSIPSDSKRKIDILKI